MLVTSVSLRSIRLIHMASSCVTMRVLSTTDGTTLSIICSFVTVSSISYLRWRDPTMSAQSMWKGLMFSAAISQWQCRQTALAAWIASQLSASSVNQLTSCFITFAGTVTVFLLLASLSPAALLITTLKMVFAISAPLVAAPVKEVIYVLAVTLDSNIGGVTED